MIRALLVAFVALAACNIGDPPPVGVRGEMIVNAECGPRVPATFQFSLDDHNYTDARHPAFQNFWCREQRWMGEVNGHSFISMDCMRQAGIRHDLLSIRWDPSDEYEVQGRGEFVGNGLVELTPIIGSSSCLYRWAAKVRDL